MAYVARTPEEDQYNSQSQNLQKQNQLQQQSGSQLQKSSIADTSGATGKQATAQTNAAPGEFTKSNFSNATKILDRNKNADTSAITGRLLGNTQQEANAEQQNYANSANRYRTDTTKAVDDKYGSFDIDRINKALNGDQNESNAVSQTYARQSADPLAAINVQKYGDLQPQEFYQNSDYQPLLQKRSGQQYTSGMGALDAAVLNRSNAGQQIKNQVAGLQKGVNDAYTKAAGTQDELQNYANTKQAKQRTDLGSTLTGLNQGIQTDINSRLGAAQTKQDALANSIKLGAQSDLNDKIRNAISQLTGQRNEASKYGISGSSLDDDFGSLQSLLAGKNPTGDEFADQTGDVRDRFINLNNPKLTAGNITTQADADKLNKLSSWLGNGQTAAAGSIAAPTADTRSQDFENFLNNYSDNDRTRALQQQIDTAKADQQFRAAMGFDPNKNYQVPAPAQQKITYIPGTETKSDYQIPDDPNYSWMGGTSFV